MSGLGLSLFSYLNAVIWATVVIGMLWYAIEKHVIVHIYRWAYDIAHAVPMPADAERGLVLGRPTSQQRWIVSIASLIQSAYMVWSGHANVFAEMIAMVLEVVIFLGGFWLGEKLHQRYSLTRVLEKFDRIGDARNSVGTEEVKAGAKSIFSQVAQGAMSLSHMVLRTVFPSRTKKVPPVGQTPVKPSAPEKAPPAPEVDRSDDVFKEWTGRRR